MISICNDKELIYKSLCLFQDSVYISETIRLYLDSYGTDFDFCQYYLQFSDDNKEIKSVVMRYNSQVYVLSQALDNQEMLSFVKGFHDCVIISDNCYPCFDTCYVMQKRGTTSSIINSEVKFIDSPKQITNLVAHGFDKEKAEDFFLNTAHQLRHNLISVSGIYKEGTLVSVVSFTENSLKYSVITFVYTDEYFRGNGLSRKILSSVCHDENKTYILLCEKHNVEFYKKCGFEQNGFCYKIRL